MLRAVSSSRNGKLTQEKSAAEQLLKSIALTSDRRAKRTQDQQADQNPKTCSGTKKTSRSSKYPDENETQELVSRAQRGDVASLNKVIETHTHLAKWYVGRCRGFGLEDADDIFQDAILSIYRAVRLYKPRLDKNGNLFPFYRFAMWSIRHEAHLKRKKIIKKNQNEFLSRDGTQDEGVEDEFSDRAQALVLFKLVFRRAKSTLRPKFYTVFRLYYGRGMTEKVIADELGVSRQVVNWRLRKARKILGEVLEVDGLSIAESWYSYGRPPKN